MNTIPIVVNGVQFASKTAVARNYETSTAIVNRAVHEGWLDRLPDFVARQKNRRQPVKLNGVEYRSMRQASKMTGVDRGRIERILDAGLDVAPAVTHSNKPRPVICNDTGERFPSVAAAARSVGALRGYMLTHLKRHPNFPHCKGRRFEYEGV